VCQKDPGLAYKNVIVNGVFLDTLLNKLPKVAEIAYTPSKPEIDKNTPPKHNTWNYK